jgi:hypothetical protein
MGMVFFESLASLASAVCIRWIYNLSTPQKDYRAFKRFIASFEKIVARFEWYRGLEYVHQMRAKRLLA